MNDDINIQVNLFYQKIPHKCIIFITIINLTY